MGNAKVKLTQHGRDNEELAALKTYLMNVPPEHLEGLAGIEITNSWLQYENEGFPPKNVIYGSYSPVTQKIMISRYPYWNDVKLRYTPKDIYETSLHEIGHHYYYKKLIYHKETVEELKEIHKIVYNNQDFSDLKASKKADFEEFVADLYRQKVLDYVKIEDTENILQSYGYNYNIKKIMEKK